MKCTNCGHDLPEDGKFCENCGAKIEQEPAPVAEPVVEAEPVVPAPEIPVIKKKPNISLIAALSTIGAVILAVVLFFVLSGPKTVPDKKAKGIIEDVVEILEDDNVDYEKAAKKINKMKLEKDSQYTEIFAEIKEIVAAKPSIVSTNSDDYPNVTVEFEVDGNVEYSKNDFAVTDEYSEEAMIASLEKNGKIYKLTYAATYDGYEDDVENKMVFKKYKNLDFGIPFEFDAKEITSANLTFVTSNVEAYPEISLFLRATDEYGNPIENLTAKSFIVREYLNINDYLERDVIYAAKADGNAALNVSLALDRSSSLNDEDMRKIKNATNTFLSKLQFASGDKAEIVSFDTNVMQMCMFTNNKDNLINGVNSMHPYGLTACYDAIIRSIQNASVQNGARCVIVFTDGDDTKSRSSVDDVIRLAKEKSVPVYTIGVGRQLQESRLRRIANETGGTYHHIDDISSMSRIYDEIYKDQKNLYQVKYISDASIPQDSERRIIAMVSGNGYKGTCDRTYKPVTPVIQQQHASRYEVIKADITWEDANRICIEKGGHLATIASKAEEDQIIAVAEQSGVERLWIGGYTTNDANNKAVGHWVMGEPFEYQNWYNAGEPSRFDSDNAEEFYLMLWKIDNRWSWNDQRNDLINSPFRTTYEGKMGYVIEYEN